MQTLTPSDSHEAGSNNAQNAAYAKLVDQHGMLVASDAFVRDASGAITCELTGGSFRIEKDGAVTSLDKKSPVDDGQSVA